MTPSERALVSDLLHGLENAIDLGARTTQELRRIHAFVAGALEAGLMPGDLPPLVSAEAFGTSLMEAAALVARALTPGSRKAERMAGVVHSNVERMRREITRTNESEEEEPS